jgi:hypothetical protein
MDLDFYFNVFIFLISPIAGIAYIIAWFVKYKKNKNYRPLQIGILLIAFPIITFFYRKNNTANLIDKYIIGNYHLKGGNEIVLKINKDNTYEISKIGISIQPNKGKWRPSPTNHVDLEITEGGEVLQLDVVSMKDKTVLSTYGGSSSGIEFEKNNSR